MPRTPGVHLAGIADLSPDGARANLQRVGWPAEQTAAASIDDAIRSSATHVGDDWQALVRHPAIDVIVECTATLIAAVDHCLEAFAHGKARGQRHRRGRRLLWSAAGTPRRSRRGVFDGFGDQPALICDLVDWARTCGFSRCRAGRAATRLPHFCESTPETVWGYYGLTPERRAAASTRRCSTAFDGSKPSIESTAVANATGLAVLSDGLLYLPGSIDQIPNLTPAQRRRRAGEEGHGRGDLITAPGRHTDQLRHPHGRVTVEAETDYIAHRSRNTTRRPTTVGAISTPTSAGTRSASKSARALPASPCAASPPASRRAWHADVVATAKRDQTRRVAGRRSAATPSGASCNRHPSPSPSAACRSAWRTR